MVKKLKINRYLFIIFAAGKGRRLGKIGKKIPKSLLQINNKTILRHNIEKLEKLGIKNIYLLVGYKKQKIIQHLKNFKKVKLNYLEIKNFSKYGHGMTWLATRKLWFKEKKPLIIMHGDIIYNTKYLTNIINSKKKNLIGISSRQIISNKKKENWVVELNRKKQILKIDYLKNLKVNSGEILGINKISSQIASKIYNFMHVFLKKEQKKKSWEFVINKFIEQYPKQLYTLINQNYNWVNINTVKDYQLAKKLFKNYEK